jgi:Lipopolysaccharide-assembly
MTTRQTVVRALCVLCVASSTACGYTLAGRGSFLPTYIKTIGIPAFTNRTTIFNFETQLTAKVRSEFIGRGKYQIVPDDTGVDALLTGEILSAIVTPISLNPTTGLSNGNAVTVVARVELRSLHDNTVIWQNGSMSFREEYAAQNSKNVTDPSAFFSQDTSALDRLSADFARTIVTAILEAF